MQPDLYEPINGCHSMSGFDHLISVQVILCKVTDLRQPMLTILRAHSFVLITRTYTSMCQKLY